MGNSDSTMKRNRLKLIKTARIAKFFPQERSLKAFCDQSQLHGGFQSIFNTLSEGHEFIGEDYLEKTVNNC